MNRTLLRPILRELTIGIAPWCRPSGKPFPWLLLALMPLWYGCEPDGPEALEDYDVVVTNYDSSYNFAAVRTYYLIDTVVHATGSAGQSSSPELDRTLDRYILTQLATELNNLGYTRITAVTPAQRPDVLVTVSGLTTTTTNVNYYYYNWWNYYDWWGGWNTWYPSYTPAYYPYWGYPYAYSAYASSYTTGTLLVEMSTPNQPLTAQQRFPLVWRASLNGLLSNNQANTQARIATGLRQAITQSPYLQRTAPR